MYNSAFKLECAGHDGLNLPIEKLYQGSLPIALAKLKDVLTLATSYISPNEHPFYDALSASNEGDQTTLRVTVKTLCENI